MKKNIYKAGLMYISPADNQWRNVTKYIYSRDLLKYSFEVLYMSFCTFCYIQGENITLLLLTTRDFADSMLHQSSTVLH